MIPHTNLDNPCYIALYLIHTHSELYSKYLQNENKDKTALHLTKKTNKQAKQQPKKNTLTFLNGNVGNIHFTKAVKISGKC